MGMYKTIAKFQKHHYYVNSIEIMNKEVRKLKYRFWLYLLKW